MKMEGTDLIRNYQKTENILQDVKWIIESAEKKAHSAVNLALIQRNWLLGYRIAEEEMKGEDRAVYGSSIISNLSKELTKEYGKGFTKTNLYSYYSFYKYFPAIFHTVCGKSLEILSWSHYRVLLQVADESARNWYAKGAYEQTWSVRTLHRNISSQYYYRMLKSQNSELVEDEMRAKTNDFQTDKLEFIKNPVIAEFLGIQASYTFTENELKTSKITHQDVGQMDMYIRMYDELKKGEDDNPTIGIVLCSTVTSNCLLRNTNCTSRPRKNCGQRLKCRKICFTFRRKKCG